MVEHLPGHGFTKINLAEQHLANRVQELGPRFVFHQVTARARAQRPLCIDRFIMHRMHQHRQFRMAHLQVLDEFNSVLATERDVHDGQIGLGGFDQLQRALNALGLGAHDQIAGLINHPRQSLAHGRMVVHHHDAPPFRRDAG